ncbi:hypothetical protein EYF80_034624 [Liparis tanakae]|uniref:Uncharacterized protein n=1 Tax=Liparis tanakae TaxID=230148 RepID=A0A4Z2GPA1_9TELE|nr:hypothetical protein EYF80_034624 [Liparis tanakae]
MSKMMSRSLSRTLLDAMSSTESGCQLAASSTVLNIHAQQGVCSSRRPRTGHKPLRILNRELFPQPLGPVINRCMPSSTWNKEERIHSFKTSHTNV